MKQLNNKKWKNYYSRNSFDLMNSMNRGRSCETLLILVPFADVLKFVGVFYYILDQIALMCIFATSNDDRESTSN